MLRKKYDNYCKSWSFIWIVKNGDSDDDVRWWYINCNFSNWGFKLRVNFLLRECEIIIFFDLMYLFVIKNFLFLFIVIDVGL